MAGIKRWFSGALVFLLIIFLLAVSGFFASAANDLSCFFINDFSCPAGTAKLIGVRNDTDGFQNAHAQNNTLDSYNYSVCCNVTDNASITITSTCPGNETVIRLSSETNAHVEIGSNSNYSIQACLGADWKFVSCAYPTGSCGAGYSCILSMSNSEGANSSNAHVGNCSAYDQKVCCKLDNNAPNQPSLVYPADGNQSVFERKPNFNWTCTEPDGDSLEYAINITCGDGCPAACTDINTGSLTASNYTVGSALCVDQLYNWSVTACDPYDECNTSEISNFTIASVAQLEFLINTTNFGGLGPGESNDTTDDSPSPFVVRNTGNVLLNVTINASALFESVALNTNYYQFKADENETSSYNAGCSQDASFANMNSAEKNLFCNLSYVAANDEGEIEFNITIPSSEGAGSKSSSVQVGYGSTE